MSEFLGQPYAYWIELKHRVDRGDPVGDARLLNEVISLQGKVAFYESRIKEMTACAGITASHSGNAL